VIRTDVEPGALPRRLGIAVSAFNAPITDPMLDAALVAAERAGVEETVVVRVPGAMELPLAARALAEGGCDAIVAIGAVIKGETDHYEYVAEHATRGITDVSTTTGVPVGNALLTVRDYEHAVERSLPGPGNKGAEATEAAIDLARRLKALKDLGGAGEVHSSQ
jgi:6,7-dimethyl-8-ribityllumazine synthase